MDDLELQNALRGRIFARLVKAGVRRIDIESPAFFEEMKLEGDQEDFADLFHDMVRWLAHENILRFDAESFDRGEGSCFYSVSMTSQGSALADMKYAETGITVREASQSGDADTVTNIGQFIGSAIAGFLKGFS